MKCIICKGEFESLSAEHIFPDAIGGSLVVNNVCKSCNSRLGDEVDILLTDHYLITLIRNALGIKGKSGIIPNPFREGVTEDGQKVRMIISEDGKFLPQYVSRLSKITDNKVRLIIDSKDSKQLPDIIKKIFERRKVDITDKEIQEIIGKMKIESSQPTIQYDISINTLSYKKALVKIAYEMGVYWLGNEYINDPVGNELRKSMFLSNDELKNSKIHGQIGLVNEIDFPLFSLQEISGMHLAILFPDGDRRYCVIRIFDVFATIILISENGCLYNNIGSGCFMTLDPQKRTFTESTFIEALNKYVKG